MFIYCSAFSLFEWLIMLTYGTWVTPPPTLRFFSTIVLLPPSTESGLTGPYLLWSLAASSLLLQRASSMTPSFFDEDPLFPDSLALLLRITTGDTSVCARLLLLRLYSPAPSSEEESELDNVWDLPPICIPFLLLPKLSPAAFGFCLSAYGDDRLQIAWILSYAWSLCWNEQNV